MCLNVTSFIQPKIILISYQAVIIIFIKLFRTLNKLLSSEIFPLGDISISISGNPLFREKKFKNLEEIQRVLLSKNKPTSVIVLCLNFIGVFNHVMLY